MKAAVIPAPGRSPVHADFAEPVVTAGRRVVSLVAAGIHPIVRARAAGQHYSAAGRWPAVVGIDAVARTEDGDLVYTGFVEPPWGTVAERMAVPSGFGVPLPPAADPLAVAAGLNPGLASWLPFTRRRNELAGRGLGTVLVLGATGVAGGIAVANALVCGARTVVAVGRSAEQLDHLRQCREGDQVRTVTLAGGSGAEAITEALAGQPPSIVVDFVWGPVAEDTFRALMRPELDTDDLDVRYVQIGAAAGAEAQLPAALLRSRRIELSGAGLGSTSPQAILEQLPDFMACIDDESVTVPYTAYPLSRVADAWVADDRTRAVIVPD